MSVHAGDLQVPTKMPKSQHCLAVSFAFFQRCFWMIMRFYFHDFTLY